MSSKQKEVDRSRIEAEYMVLAFAPTEIIWLQSILKKLKVHCAYIPILFTDNTNVKLISSTQVMHGRMKHMEIDFNFIRNLVMKSEDSIHRNNCKMLIILSTQIGS